MRRLSLILFPCIFLIAACTKEQPALTATFHAACQDCIVSYAVGPAQSHRDTLIGAIDPDNGTLGVIEREWQVELKDGDNLFLRGCQRDTVFHGDIALSVDGDVRSVSITASSDSCAEINQPAHAK
jgi:hypothetical protein